jgi:fluoride exporter
LTSSEKRTSVDAKTQENERPGAGGQEADEETEERLDGESSAGQLRAGHPRIATMELVAVAGGGAVGGVIRVGVTEMWTPAAGSWPWGTFVVNIAGAFLLGCVVAALRRHGGVSIALYRLLGTGLCGALTTFSTMQIELLEMIDRGRYGLAGGYLAMTVAGGYLAVSIGPKVLARTVVAGEPGSEPMTEQA